MSQPKCYVPIVAKCEDWSVYSCRGFFSRKFSGAGRLLRTTTFVSFHNGAPNTAVAIDMTSYEMINAIDLTTQEVAMIE